MRTPIRSLAVVASLAVAACGPAPTPKLPLGSLPVHVVDGGDSVLNASALAVDAAGAPRIAYLVEIGHYPKAGGSRTDLGPTGPFYATWAGDHWQREQIEEAESGLDIGIALDGNGRPHVLYTVVTDEYDHEALHYAVRGPGGWSVENVPLPTGTPADYIQGAALAIDPAGRPHIAFSTGHLTDGVGGTWRVWYGVREGGRWKMTLLAKWHWGIFGTSPRLVLDRHGRPWVLYVLHYDAELMLAHETAHGWSKETLVVTPGSMDDWIFDDTTSLGAGPDGAIHVSFARCYTVEHMVRGTEKRGPEDVFDFPVDKGAGNLAVRADGVPVLAYSRMNRYGDGQPELFAPSPTGWRHAVLHEAARPGDTVHMVLGPAGDPRLVYISGDKGLIYAGPLVGGGAKVAPGS